jgi:haloacetate dehalogenase
MFERFEHRKIHTTEALGNCGGGRAGQPIPRLHGYPQTQAMWHKLAPAAPFTVITSDLRSQCIST